MSVGPEPNLAGGLYVAAGFVCDTDRRGGPPGADGTSTACWIDNGGDKPPPAPGRLGGLGITLGGGEGPGGLGGGTGGGSCACPNPINNTPPPAVLAAPIGRYAGALCLPPHGPVAPAGPPTGPVSQPVDVRMVNSVNGPPEVSGLPITCTETGVTIFSICGSVTFFHATSGTKNYTTPQGKGVTCDTGTALTFGTGAGSGATPNQVAVDVNSLPR